MDSKFYFSFTGRINRSAYWRKYLLFPIGFLILTLLINTLPPDLQADLEAFHEATRRGRYLDFLDDTPFELVLIAISAILCIWASLAVTAKRYHDRDKSAWWMLIALIPIIGIIWLLIELGFLKGTDGPNRFGSDPSATNKKNRKRYNILR